MLYMSEQEHPQESFSDKSIERGPETDEEILNRIQDIPGLLLKLHHEQYGIILNDIYNERTAYWAGLRADEIASLRKLGAPIRTIKEI
jgi:hypothetical protein